MTPFRPPCRADCPNRSITPNCHTAELCKAWGDYEAARDAYKAYKKRLRRSEDDYQAARSHPEEEKKQK